MFTNALQDSTGPRQGATINSIIHHGQAEVAIEAVRYTGIVGRSKKTQDYYDIGFGGGRNVSEASSS